MPPKRDRPEKISGIEGPEQKKQRLADAVPDAVPLPAIPPSAPPLISVPPRRVRFIPTADEILAMPDRRRKQFRQEEWLNRSVSWDEFTTPGGGTWKGVTVLGQGNYGIAGLFTYDGPNQNIPKSLVVKQCGPKARPSLIRESRILAELAPVGSSHIVKLFKSVFYTAGTGAHPLWDPIPYIEKIGVDGTKAHTYDEKLQVSKIYMEHCAEGDLWHYDQRMRPNPACYPHEDFIWRTLECYVRGLSVLATGYEDPWITDPPAPDVPVVHVVPVVPDLQPEKEVAIEPVRPKTRGFMSASLAALIAVIRCFVINDSIPESSPEPPIRKPTSTDPSTDTTTSPAPPIKAWLPIAHFDIKTNNLFIGYADKEHQSPPRRVHKFGDFGMARHIRDPITREFEDYGRFAGAPGFKPPEQMYLGPGNQNIGLPGSIWCIAAVFYSLITKMEVPARNYSVTFIDDRGQSEFYRTQGASLLSLRRDLYSNTLLNLLMKCLAFETTDRPSLSQMKTTIGAAVAILDREESNKDPAKVKDPFFDFKASNLVYNSEPNKEILAEPPRIPTFLRAGSILDDDACIIQDMRARVDLVGFAPAGARSDTITGNTAGYSVRPVKFDLIPSTPTLREQQTIRQKADLEEFKLAAAA